MLDSNPIPPSGYPKIAVQMGLMPEVAIFRRFGFLNAQNILYMQAELVSLEERLRKIQVKDDQSPEPKSRYAKNWWLLSESVNHDDDEQWSLVQEIRGKLKDYSKLLLRYHTPYISVLFTSSGFTPLVFPIFYFALCILFAFLFRFQPYMPTSAYQSLTRIPDKALVQQIKIVATEHPSMHDLRYIQNYLESSEMDEFLTGKDANVWGSVDAPDDRAPDLLSLLPRHNEDFFSRWMTGSAVEKLLRLSQGRRRASTTATASPSTAHRNNLVGVKDDIVLRCTFVFVTMLASGLPILAIVILYSVKSLTTRLGLIAVFNMLLSLSLATFTSAKRADIFAVSAAFSAVQVVFVQVGTSSTDGVVS